ncbi:MAG: hypothetical protein JNL90_00180 [Planctomycetes bacterium]|nr:hypothetical protein [Planctomycetota bacterium]
MNTDRCIVPAPARRSLACTAPPLALLALLVAPRAYGQVTSLVSTAADGTQADSPCSMGDLSDDGRYCAFVSRSRVLGPGTTTANLHVWVKDRATGAIELASLLDSGAELDRDCTRPRISADGRFVVFETAATNGPGDSNGFFDCYLRDLDAGTTERVSVGPDGELGNGESRYPVVSGDGRYVLFTSFADNFSDVDFNGTADVFLRDRLLGTTTLVSVALDGTSASDYSEAYDLTPDGRFALFRSASTDIVAGSIAHWNKVLLRDVVAGVTEQASLTWDGKFVAADCVDGRVTADGRYVTFTCGSQTVVPGDSNQADDVFLRDRVLGTTERVNVGELEQQDDRGGLRGRPSDDGRFVLFASAATNFASTDTNDAGDAYLRDRWRGETRHVSLSTEGLQSKSGGGNPELSADGRVAMFLSATDELVADDRNGVDDIVVHERAPSAATRSSYGAGFPGWQGIPTVALADDPVIGRPIDLVVSNSAGSWTLGFVLIGGAPLDLPAGWGGSLLVDPVALLPIPLPPTGYTLAEEVPYDAEFWDVVLYLQVIELDPGAFEGLSSTAGLEIRFGS